MKNRSSIFKASAPNETSVEPYIDKREVARRLNRSLRAVNNLMSKGLLPYYRFDCQVAFRWSEIQTHLAETCRVAPKGGQQ